MKAASSLPFATLALAACTASQELDRGTLHDDNDPAAEEDAYGADPIGRFLRRTTLRENS